MSKLSMSKISEKSEMPEHATPISDRYPITFTVRQEWIRSAQAIFKDSLARTLLTYRDSAEAVVPMYLSFIQNNTIEGITTISGLKALSDMVHCDATMREFMRLLQANFFTSWAEDEDAWTCLVNSMTAGLCLDTTDSGDIFIDLPIIPEEITERTMNTSEMRALLLTNRWLVMSVMIFLWGGIDF